MPSALGDLGLDLLNVAAEKVGHIGDRHAVSHELVKCHVQGGPGLAGVDGFQAGRGLLTHTQHGRNTGQPDPEITGSAAAPPTRRTTTASSDETMANATAEAQIGLSNANRGRRSAMCVLSARNTLAADTAAMPRSAIMTTPSVGN